MSGWVAGYDPGGSLVALGHWSDIDEYCNETSRTILYGEMPDCEVLSIEDLCMERMQLEDL